MFGRIVSVHERGFGFIRPNGTRDEVYFHAKNLVDRIKFDKALIGERVEFDLEQSDRGPRATKVQPATA